MSEPRETARQIAERFFKGGLPESLADIAMESLVKAIEQHVASLTADLAQARQSENDARNLCERVHIQPLLSREYPPLDPPELRDEDGSDLGLDHERAMRWLVQRSLDADRLERELAAAEQARDEALAKLALAAAEINCAGPVHERIRVLRRELTERAESATRTALLEAAEDLAWLDEDVALRVRFWLTTRAGGPRT